MALSDPSMCLPVTGLKSTEDNLTDPCRRPPCVWLWLLAPLHRVMGTRQPPPQPLTKLTIMMSLPHGNPCSLWLSRRANTTSDLASCSTMTRPMVGTLMFLPNTLMANRQLSLLLASCWMHLLCPLRDNGPLPMLPSAIVVA